MSNIECRKFDVRCFRHSPHYPDGVWRTISGNIRKSTCRCDAGAGAQASDLEHGPEDHDRFGHPLQFETPRYDDFPALTLARRAGESGGTLPAVMNAANEVAVAAFLARQLRFPQIWQTVEEVMNQHATVAHPDLDAILRADQWA